MWVEEEVVVDTWEMTSKMEVVLCRGCLAASVVVTWNDASAEADYLHPYRPTGENVDDADDELVVRRDGVHAATDAKVQVDAKNRQMEGDEGRKVC